MHTHTHISYPAYALKHHQSHHILYRTISQLQCRNKNAFRKKKNYFKMYHKYLFSVKPFPDLAYFALKINAYRAPCGLPCLHKPS